MLSGAIGLQIIARRLGVELGEQQFNKFNDIDTRELTFKEIKKLTSDHSLVCRALKTNSSGLAAAGDNDSPAPAAGWVVAALEIDMKDSSRLLKPE